MQEKKVPPRKRRAAPPKKTKFRFQFELPDKERFLPEVRIEIEGSRAFCSRGHRWVPGPIQKQGIYRGMIAMLEEHEKTLFKKRNGFESHKEAIKLDMSAREPYSNMPLETKQSARKFLDKLRTPVHLEYTSSYNTIEVLKRFGYEIEWFSKEQFGGGREGAHNVFNVGQIIRHHPELDGHILFILAKPLSE